jgi:hypothetical protein
MEALFACLASSVPITFLSLDGEVVGLCLGRDRPEESLAMLLDRLLAETGWAEIYQRWCKAVSRPRQGYHRVGQERTFTPLYFTRQFVATGLR